MRLKVFGWTAFVETPYDRSVKQTRVVVATTSFAKARDLADAAGLNKPTRDYTSETGNDEELAVALGSAGTVFARLGRHGGYHPVAGGVLTLDGEKSA